ncbi:hypothetical protein GWK08_14780 [Leptobacterium flavescens]|uniref:DUF3792 family protein n=1 Tax=Leptobacterium flavescens TaxID=472055 RepID=A0A6P0USC6_9FLAO|nr:hypothetical protein [Leptobacterium flavescens]NER14719.1 hypothetical protein [Leptobacterium flavescens]
MIRNLLAVVAGYVFFTFSAVLLFGFGGIDYSRVVSPNLILISAFVGGLFAFFAGYLTAGIARENAKKAGIALSALIAIIALVSILAQAEAETYWSQLLTIFLFAPLAYAGSRIKNKRSE